MGTAPTEVLAFPKISAIVRENRTAEVIVAGNSRIVPAGESLQELRNNALALVVGEAQTLQRPVRVQIEDPEGHGELIVHPDNKIESVSYEPRPARRRAEAPETTPGTLSPAVTEAALARAPQPAATRQIPQQSPLLRQRRTGRPRRPSPSHLAPRRPTPWNRRPPLSPGKRLRPGGP
ncbi:hypothetical protein AHiyo8_pI66600 (plasmid) [Arthrobacter sp. Hiyo8]|nr:hypothetical protein AHiyo8_pI66600 [Arthrobacter sp. Hiyo8]